MIFEEREKKKTMEIKIVLMSREYKKPDIRSYLFP